MTLKQSENFPQASWHKAYWQALIAFAGLIISIRMFYPGIMSNDSLDQYSQALHFSFKDWHPPIVAFVWALINDWIPGPFGMLLLFCGMYWAGLLLLSLSIGRSSQTGSIVLLVLGFAPFAIGTLGNIWKDVFHAVFTLCAVGLFAFAYRHEGRWNAAMRSAAYLLLLMGAMARFNAIAALPPLLWLALGRPRLNNWKMPAVLLVLPFSVLLVSSVFNYGFLRAERTGVVSSLLVFDIGAVTNATGSNAFGQPFSPEQEKKLTNQCYEPAAWDSYAWGSCAFVAPALKASGAWASGGLFHAWANAVQHHPAAYLRHRFTHWWRLLWKPQNLLVSEMQSNELGFTFQKSALHLSLERITEIMQRGIFFKPGFWLLLSIALVAISVRRGSGPLRDLAIALNLSGILYLFSYLPVGVATDFRYAYWSILAAWMSLPFVYCSLRQPRVAAVPDLRSSEPAAVGIKRAPGRRASNREAVGK